MADFGDFEAADAFDPAEPEPEPLARAILLFERVLSGDPKRPETLEELDPREAALRVYVAARLITRLRDEGSL